MCRTTFPAESNSILIHPPPSPCKFMISRASLGAVGHDDIMNSLPIYIERIKNKCFIYFVYIYIYTHYMWIYMDVNAQVQSMDDNCGVGGMYGCG